MKRLHTSTIIIIGLLSIVLGLLMFGMWYVRTSDKPGVGNCSNLKKEHPEIKWSEDCDFIQEITPDGSLKTPLNPLYLSEFASSPSLGPPLGANTWYRYRYVREDTGGYGKFSPWTKTPIIAGSNNLPCKGGDCSNMKSHGADSCNANLVTLGVDALDYNIQSGIYANVHRAALEPTDSSPPDDSTLTEIVGYLWPRGNTWFFIDTTKSPCVDTNIQCNRPGC